MSQEDSLVGRLLSAPTAPGIDILDLDTEKHDTNKLSDPIRQIKCAGSGAAGDVVIVTLAGFSRTFPISPGETWNIQCDQVKSTGTTATGLWGIQ